SSLGKAYHTGDGVPRDYAQAFQWFRKAADQGDATARSNLGFMYQNGEGVGRDPALAVQWWHRAAEQGNTSSQYNLGVAYNNGEGVAQISLKRASGPRLLWPILPEGVRGNSRPCGTHSDGK